MKQEESSQHHRISFSTLQIHCSMKKKKILLNKTKQKRRKKVGEIFINHACCQLLDLNLSQLDLSQSNTCPLWSPHTSDDYLCSICPRPPVKHFWKDINNKQSNILDYCLQLSPSLCLPGDHTAVVLNHLAMVTLLVLTVAKECILPDWKNRKKMKPHKMKWFYDIINLSGKKAKWIMKRNIYGCHGTQIS